VTPVSDDDATAAFYSALAEDDPAELYDNAPCGYLSALPDGTIIKANATFLTWTGYDRDKLVGRRRFQDLLPALDCTRTGAQRQFGAAYQHAGDIDNGIVGLHLPAHQLVGF